MSQTESWGPRRSAARPGSRPPRRYRSSFWAVVLIGIGVVWLLAGLDIVSAAHLSVLARLWPLLLIGIGFDLLVGHRSLVAGGLVGAGTAGLLVALMLAGPSLGWAGRIEFTKQTHTTPVGPAVSAQIDLDLSRYPTTVRALPQATGPERPLVVASVDYRGPVDFQVSGELQKAILLQPDPGPWWWRMFENSDAHPWDIELDPALPLALDVRTSAGPTVLDLSGLQIAGLRLDSSSEDVQVILPVTGPQTLGAHGYAVVVRAGSGSLTVHAPDGARFDLSVDVGSGEAEIAVGRESNVDVSFVTSSGQLILDLPSGLALRVEVRQMSSGEVRIPAGLLRVERTGDGDGTWETRGYAGAAYRVSLTVDDVGSGRVIVRQGG